MKKDTLGEVILEFIHVGNAVKVSAVDPVTLTEVSIVGDPSVGEETLTRLAIRKLDYVLKRKLLKHDRAAPEHKRTGRKRTGHKRTRRKQTR